MSQNPPSTNEWTGTAEQKLWGLMQIWSETKYNFAFFDRHPDLDWDVEVQKCIPQVLAAKDMVEYYHVLQEFVALLNDGHTVVMFSRETRASLDAPPLELQMVEEKIVITRVGETAEIKNQSIHPGLELVEVDGCPARKYLQDNAVRYYRGGTEQWGKAFGLFNLLQGQRGSVVSLTLKELDGQTRVVNLKRNSTIGEGQTFKHRILDFDPLVETKLMDGIAYFRLSTFENEQIIDRFNQEMDRLDLNTLKGMIIDIRYNIGGESGIAFKIISRLTDKPLEAAKWRTRKYLPAYRAWGNSEEWFEDKMPTIQPYVGTRYTGPLTVLIGPHTFSSAEDFLVPLAHAKPAMLVGDKTAGSTGQPLRVILPGGGYCLICTLQSTFPDGREFVGYGIEPDIIVRPTQKNICENRDVVLERAIVELTRSG
jgi:carboxyl-terminal processing protease